MLYTLSHTRQLFARLNAIPTSIRPIHTVNPKNISLPYNIPVLMDKAPEQVIFMGNPHNTIAALERIAASKPYYKDTKFLMLVGQNWQKNVKGTPFDQPWGQAYGELSPAIKKNLQSLKKYKDIDQEARPSISQYGEIMDLIMRTQKKELNNVTIYSVDFKDVTLVPTKNDLDEEVSLRIQTPSLTLEVPAEGTLVYNNATIYGRLVLGNHNLKDKNDQQLELTQGTDLWSGKADPEQNIFLGFGLGLSSVWAARNLEKQGKKLLCLYDKERSGPKSMDEVMDANPANTWIKQDAKSTQVLFSAAVQDCVFEKNNQNEWIVELPTGEKLNVGKKLYDFTGYDHALHITKVLPESMVYSHSDAGLFAFGTDTLKAEVEKIISEGDKLSGKDKDNYDKLLKLIIENHALKQKLSPINNTISASEFRKIEKEVVKNVKGMLNFVRDKNGEMQKIFNRYYEDRHIAAPHVPQGSAPENFALQSEANGHQASVNLFDSHLIRDLSLTQAMKQQFLTITGETLHDDIIKEFNKSLVKNLHYEKNFIFGSSIENRIASFKATIKKHYPNISADKLEEYCNLQKYYY